ncbi:MAG: transglycosylase domain-containing protein [Merdibacter sp.]
MKKLFRVSLWLFFVTLSLFLLIYTYALCAPLSLYEQRQHITLYDKNGDVLYESNFGENSEWISLDEIPPQVQDAFIAVEDKRFYLHFGFDPIRMAGAAKNNLFSDSILQGGSTITQQFAKNLFLTNEQTLSRKIEEFFYAVRLEMHYDKAMILEGYLNTLYFGHGVIGVKEAASYYFGKELEDLNAGELARLVGVVNGPGAFSPISITIRRSAASRPSCRCCWNIDHQRSRLYTGDGGRTGTDRSQPG